MGDRKRSVSTEKLLEGGESSLCVIYGQLANYCTSDLAKTPGCSFLPRSCVWLPPQPPPQHRRPPPSASSQHIPSLPFIRQLRLCLPQTYFQEPTEQEDAYPDDYDTSLLSSVSLLM